MDKPEITTEPIPDEEIENMMPQHSKRFWYPKMHRSQWQLQDKEYKKLKEYLIDFYTTSPKDTLLYWAEDGTESGDSPITIHYLDFCRSGCGCCGTMYEIPNFGGEILIEGKKYKYDGSIYGERWCETEDYGINERISDEKMSENIKSKYFLFKLDIINGPFLFYHIYTELSNFSRLKYINNNKFWNDEYAGKVGKDTLQTPDNTNGIFLKGNIFCLNEKESLNLRFYNIGTKTKDGLWGLITDIYLVTPDKIKDDVYWSNEENISIVEILRKHPELIVSRNSNDLELFKKNINC